METNMAGNANGVGLLCCNAVWTCGHLSGCRRDLIIKIFRISFKIKSFDIFYLLYIYKRMCVCVCVCLSVCSRLTP
jgi:hypothetical protein